MIHLDQPKEFTLKIAGSKCRLRHVFRFDAKAIERGTNGVMGQVVSHHIRV